MDKAKRYPVRSLISFDALENPSWHSSTRSKETPTKTVTEMINCITQYHKRWEKAVAENRYHEDLIKKVKEDFLLEFVFHVNREEGHGIATFKDTEIFLRNCSSERRMSAGSSFSLEEQETVNLINAYESLLEKIKSEERTSDYGLLEVGLLKETHRLILQNIPQPGGLTKPGEMSNKPRVTEFKGEIYHYANPDDMESTVINLLDKYNFLYDSCIKEKGGPNEDIDVYSLLKTCSWFLFELLDLHPFSDGNGRLCRILSSYCLSKLNPFPTPIYNVWTNSCKGDYIEALVEARKSPDRQPCALTTMIIECSYYGWEKFFKALQGSTDGNYVAGNSRKVDKSCLTLSNSYSNIKHLFEVPTLPCVASVPC